MDVDFWAQRWREGRIGFHEGRPNTFLERHIGRLGEGRRVLVPFCGKAEDLAFLAAHGHDVVGVEVVEAGARAFFAEHGLEDQLEVTEGEHGRAYSARAARITIVCADLFACSRRELGPVDALYDRAALIAVRPESRPQYVSHIRGLVGDGAPGLVVTFEYPPGAIEGPPFSVGEAEMRKLYAGAQVETIDSGPAPLRSASPGTSALEQCFAIST